jgi:hypothetical protein
MLDTAGPNTEVCKWYCMRCILSKYFQNTLTSVVIFLYVISWRGHLFPLMLGDGSRNPIIVVSNAK